MYFQFSRTNLLHGKGLLNGFNISVKIFLTKITFWFWILCYLPNMSPFCICSISWCYFAVLLFRWCSPVSAVPVFPSDLKLADVTPVYKKTSKNSKDNYRPVSILWNISKIYKRCMYDQIQLFFDSLLPKYQCGFCRS